MSQVPDELAEVVHRAAAGTADYPADVRGVERRWHRRRRRRAIAGAAGTAVLAAVSLAAVPVINGRPGPDRPPVAAADQPAQRLMVGGGTWSAMGEDVTDAGVVFRRGAAELLPDGSVKRWPLPDLDLKYQVVGLPGDRLGLLDVAVTSRGASTAPNLTIRVVSGTGAVESAMPVGAGPALLVAVSTDTAYLWRPEGIVGYNLVTGAHRVLVPAASLGVNPFSGPATDADLVGQTLAVTMVSHGACRLRTIDVRDGHAADHPVTQQACDGTGSVQISPDGRLAAVIYQPTTGAPQAAVIDLGTGRIRADVPIQAPGGAREQASPAGLAWQDNARVRIAVIVPPPRTGGPHYVESLVRQQIVDVR